MRMRVALVVAAATLGAVAVAPALAAPAAIHGVTTNVSHGRLIPTKGELLPQRDADATSLNWSGYAATGSTITAVASTWTVPAAGLVPPGFGANWTGIGGYTSTDLIQAGTSEDSLPLGGPQYYAWYEILPATETLITGCSGDANCTVRPGDRVTVDIHETSPLNNSWVIAMSNAGHWTWSTSLHYTSTHSSAEWILEAPTLAVLQTIVAPVGTTYFGQTNTFTDSKGTHTIAAGNPVSIAMGPGLINEATPSGLAPNGMSFNDCAYAQSCPTPAA